MHDYQRRTYTHTQANMLLTLCIWIFFRNYRNVLLINIGIKTKYMPYVTQCFDIKLLNELFPFFVYAFKPRIFCLIKKMILILHICLCEFPSNSLSKDFLAIIWRDKQKLTSLAKGMQYHLMRLSKKYLLCQHAEMVNELYEFWMSKQF